ncbi:twin-arginine translocase subunit TatC [Methanococcoides sp. SA1]|nr:twin-arginine translocase subunit TatC [Methanococcoides sp. SA1]
MVEYVGPTKPAPEDYDTPLAEHFGELRKRLFVVAIALFGLMMVAFPFSEIALKMVWANFIPQNIEMFVYSPLEWIFAKLKLSLVFSVAFTFPLFLYEMFKFASRGLYQHEKKFFLKIVPVSFLLFIIGGSLAYYIVLPLMFKYIIFYSTETAISQIAVQSVLAAVTNLILGFGLIFQVPLIIVFAIKMQIVKLEMLKRKRIFVYAAVLSLAVFMSPDPTFISQIIVAFVLAILFEIGLLIARFL